MALPIQRTGARYDSGTKLSPTVARGWAESVDFNDSAALEPLRVPREQAPTAGPIGLQRAYAFYKTWEDNDLGSVRLLKTQAGGEELFALHTTTDGDDGFLELFDRRGKLLASGVTGFDATGAPAIQWDHTPGEVRQRVAPHDITPSTAAFAHSVALAQAPGSASGTTVSKKEMVDAAAHLVLPELTTQSIDGFENAALHRVLADASTKLTSASRAYAGQLGELYSDSAPAQLSGLRKKPLGTGSAWGQAAEVSTVAVGGPVRINALVALGLQSRNLLPTQLVPITRTDAQKVLRESGASSAEAKAAVEALSDKQGQLYAGLFFEQGTDWIPKAKAVALVAVNADGNTVSALRAPLKAVPASGADPKQVIQQLLGVEREVEVVSRTRTEHAEEFALRWRPLAGGLLDASLTVPNDGSEPSIASVTMPPPNELVLEQALEQHLRKALGSAQRIFGWVGRDNNQGPGFVVAHQPAQGGPIQVSTIRIRMGGEGTVTSTPLTSSQAALARDLALQLARAHAYAMVEDPAISDAARLEVALRTRWSGPGDLQVPEPTESPVGFEPATDRFQFMLPGVWGDNAVFVTFARDGSIRIEDFN